ncbi:MAG: large subunit ribosomal protein L21, partial [Patiriisocius sp.]
ESIVGSGAKKAAPKKEAKPSAPKAEKAAPKKEESASNDVSSHTVAELKALAKEKGIAGYTSMKKAELIAALS